MGRSKVVYDLAYFKLHTIIDDNGCWIWQRARLENGYGALNRSNTHRTVYSLVNGPIPNGMVIRHKCDVRLCCNPEHLEIGTQLDNIADKAERNPQGLTKTQALEALQLLESGESQCAVADKYNVTQTTMHKLLKRKSWTHL